LVEKRISAPDYEMKDQREFDEDEFDLNEVLSHEEYLALLGELEQHFNDFDPQSIEIDNDEQMISDYVRFS
jgi:hypothetical protein